MTLLVLAGGLAAYAQETSIPEIIENVTEPLFDLDQPINDASSLNDIIYGKEPTGELEIKKEFKVNSEFERLQLEKLDKIISLLQSLRKLQQD